MLAGLEKGKFGRTNTTKKGSPHTLLVTPPLLFISNRGENRK